MKKNEKRKKGPQADDVQELREIKPSSFSQTIADKILQRIENGGFLFRVCEEEGMPSRSAFYKWMEGRPELKDAYTRARLAWADWHAEQVISLSMDAKGNFIDENGNRLPLTHEEVGARRLYVDSVKWLVGKWAPRTYGDKPIPEEQPQEITFRWEKNDSLPPPSPAPPRQLPYKPPQQIEYHQPQLPADLSPEDWSIVMSTLELIKRTIPSNSDSPPAEVFGVIKEALLAHFRDA